LEDFDPDFLPEGLEPEGLEPEGLEPEGLDPEGLEGLEPDGLDALEEAAFFVPVVFEALVAVVAFDVVGG